MSEEKIRLNAHAYCRLRYTQYSLYEGYAKKFGIGYKSLFVLRQLYFKPEGLTQMEICQNALISKQTVSAVIKGYLEKNYVYMEEISSDRRNKLVRLTESGKAYAENIVPPIIKAEQESMAYFTLEEQEKFIGMCSVYAENLKKLFD